MSLATLSPSSYVFLGLVVAVYIFIIVDRICKCFEHCSMNKSFGNLYSKINGEQIKSILEAKK